MEDSDKTILLNQLTIMKALQALLPYNSSIRSELEIKIVVTEKLVYEK